MQSCKNFGGDASLDGALLHLTAIPIIQRVTVRWVLGYNVALT